jgi:2-amino-4-hydroxy-6-hydroxymethyldihydropteridine diphosphokinase
METVIIALGSNLGNRLATIRKAGKFLADLSHDPVKKASIWESEPVGGALYTFYNTAAVITTLAKPAHVLAQLKRFEQQCGRETNPVRWGPRILDLDIIGFGNLVIEEDNLIIPHPEYTKRLFVLLPMAEIVENWVDPETGANLAEMIKSAHESVLQQTELVW